ncbi:hypothetical protein [Limnohabitans sp. 2KL-17]|nr:hypothetical protein [Limnohabitans sp. 2KL-17]
MFQTVYKKYETNLGNYPSALKHAMGAPKVIKIKFSNGMGADT